MEDFKTSLAEQNVNVTTEVVKTAVLGRSFYSTVLYVRHRDAAAKPMLITNDTLADQTTLIADTPTEQGLIISGLRALFDRAPSLEVWLIDPREYEEYKLKGYWCYVEPSYKLVWDDDAAMETLAPSDDMASLLGALNIDKAFSQVITDMFIDADLAKAGGITDWMPVFMNNFKKSVSYDVTMFARAGWAYGKNTTPAVDAATVAGNPSFSKDGAGGVSYLLSPAMTAVGEALSFDNASGSPIGNGIDMAGMIVNGNVLPTGGDPADGGVNLIWAKQFETLLINYFKPVGDGTGNVLNYGGWSMRQNCPCAEWILAYVNFMIRTGCAGIMSIPNTLVNENTYTKLLNTVDTNLQPFVRTGRLKNYILSAPGFSDELTPDGHTITIPEAWSAVFVDNLRSVRISGALTVEV